MFRLGGCLAVGTKRRGSGPAESLRTCRHGSLGRRWPFGGDGAHLNPNVGLDPPAQKMSCSSAGSPEPGVLIPSGGRVRVLQAILRPRIPPNQPRNARHRRESGFPDSRNSRRHRSSSGGRDPNLPAHLADVLPPQQPDHHLGLAPRAPPLGRAGRPPQAARPVLLLPFSETSPASSLLDPGWMGQKWDIFDGH